jgi:EAL domain-containing protein (putative c-di-GMP-specific phosphodiesterase class I)
MSMLHKLPFQKLKIDREFVTNVDHARGSQAICNAMIALGEGLGIRVLAEGTETAAEVDYLTAKGCELFQGFYFSRPVPAQNISQAFRDLSQKQAG